MKHDWYLDERGKIDVWKLEMDIHNGPQCRRCKEIFCEHCSPECFDEECPSGQQDMF